MIKVLQGWYHKYFSDPEATILFVILTLGVIALITMGQMMAPVIAGLVIAYLLEWVCLGLTKAHLPRRLAVMLVYLGFIALVAIMLFIFLPVLWHQFKNLFEELPIMIARVNELLYLMPEKFPDIISKVQIDTVVSNMSVEMKSWGKVVLSASISSIPGVISVIIYFILVPVLIFFMLKDKTLLTRWLGKHMPDERRLLLDVWNEVDDQIGNYIRGKITEIIVIGSATYLFFVLIGLKYSVLLAVLVGLSVLVPYVGAAVVTIPVVLVSYFQWGVSSEFWWLTIGYLVIQILDGNVLVPLLFSEAVNLHPVAIIVSILFFGGIWGFWGVFFAIPLATLVKAVLSAWPSKLKHE